MQYLAKKWAATLHIHNFLNSFFTYRTYLYNISSSTMELNKKHEWLNNGAEGSKCSESHYVAYDGDCYNYVMSADKKSDDLFVICAAAGVEPLCKLMKFEVGFIIYCYLYVISRPHRPHRVEWSIKEICFYL